VPNPLSGSVYGAAPQGGCIHARSKSFRYWHRSLVGCFSHHGWGSVFYGLSVTLDAVSKIVVAVITGAFGIATAVVTHALTVQRERDAEQLRRKQERYAQILERLSPYIRNRGDPTDGFATAGATRIRGRRTCCRGGYP